MFLTGSQININIVHGMLCSIQITSVQDCSVPMYLFLSHCSLMEHFTFRYPRC